jgi:hypothetical protein
MVKEKLKYFAFLIKSTAIIAEEEDGIYQTPSVRTSQIYA